MELSEFDKEHIDEMKDFNEYGSSIKSLLDTDSTQICSPNGEISSKTKLKSGFQCTNANIKCTNTPASAVESNNENICGIKVIKPLISSTELHSMMMGKIIIKLSQIHSRINSGDLDKDWVTFGVVVSKSEAKISANGKKYMQWNLNDLKDVQKNVKMLLFGEVQKKHWKVHERSVVGFLNAAVMQKNEKYKNNELTLTVDNPQKVLIIGQSRDLGMCRSQKKSGDNCRNIVNLSLGPHCEYHIQAAYKKHSAKRSELQSGHSGIQPRSFEKRLLSNGTTYSYGGLTLANHKSQKKAKSVSLAEIQLRQQQLGQKKPAVDSLMLNRIPKLKPISDHASLAELDNKVEFIDKLVLPSPGSMNLIKSLMKESNIKPSGSIESSKRKSHCPKVSTFIRQQEVEMSKPMLGRGLSSGQDVLLDFSSSAMKKAKSVVNRIGGIEKSDPNEVKKKPNIKKLIEFNHKILHKPENENLSTKQNPLLGGLDMTSDEVKKLLQDRSNHDQDITDAETKYFEYHEKKEEMENKMDSIKEQKCKATYCTVCRYTSFYGAGKLCKEKLHPLRTVRAVKRFFFCKKCKKRTESCNSKIPSDPCKNCGCEHWERCSMHRERKVALLPQEQLLVRGEERKFVNR